MAANMPIHPHSGIATVTVFADDDVTFDDFGGLDFLIQNAGTRVALRSDNRQAPTRKGGAEAIRLSRLWHTGDDRTVSRRR